MASLSDELVRSLLEERHIASLATHNSDGSIHAVSVWYLFQENGIFVATSSRSRKARNLEVDTRVSLMIDSRDPAASYGANISGTAKLLTGDSSREANARIHRKYLSEAAIADSRVGPVFATWDDVTIRIRPETVISWDMRVADAQAFGAAFAANPSYMLPLKR